MAVLAYDRVGWSGHTNNRAPEISGENLEHVEDGIERLYQYLPVFVAGFYLGDGARDRKIDLGFTPSAVLVVSEWGFASLKEPGHNHTLGGLAVPGFIVGAVHGSGWAWINGSALMIVEGGFRVNYYVNTAGYSAETNHSGSNYSYIAFR